ncbi:DUF6431 domain-containing protein [Agromyces bauzanensis]|uniref:DUF6431 domain-containing protein n=1 Tax=Agromyces bauzanensis TaxID=1308924 RepID=UPI001E4677BA|nr:helix-turn-helix domain-containing protein [Agromyces bauzanensis]
MVASLEQAEAMLHAGQLDCPGCAGALSSHGHGRTRTVRGIGSARVILRPRRARCRACAATHVLLPAELVLRRADTVEAIGTALAAKARGDGHRTIAARLGRPVSTVRRWLRRARGSHAGWLQEQAVQHAFRTDPDVLNRRLPWPTPLGDALNLLAAAALACQRRWDSTLPAWTLIGMFTHGRLLPPPESPLRT